MNSEQLLTNGICPKCFKPLYASKITDVILCECEYAVIKPIDKPLEQELKAIKGKYYGKQGYFTNGQAIYEDRDVAQIQSESYQLGKDDERQIADNELNIEKHKVEVLSDALNGVWMLMYKKPDWEYAGQVVNHINQFITEQKQDGYQLGKQAGQEEVIEKMKRWNFELWHNDKISDEISSIITDKLNQLKEQK